MNKIIYRWRDAKGDQEEIRVEPFVPHKGSFVMLPAAHVELQVERVVFYAEGGAVVVSLREETRRGRPPKVRT